MLNEERFTILLNKYTLGDISPEDRIEFMAFVTSGLYDEVLLQHIEGNLLSNAAGTNLPSYKAANILHKILASEKQSALLLPKTSIKIKMLRYAIAAVFIGVLVFSAYLVDNTYNKPPGAAISFTKDMDERVNTTSLPLKVKMEEGSFITLQPGSAIHYPAHFLREKREVFLEGDAFFEVSKNARRPFFVYNKNIIAHVLGTSFTVNLNKETNQMEVSVTSGRVEVYENKDADKMIKGSKNNSIILLPNQKAIYQQDTHRFVPSLADVPMPLIERGAEKAVPDNFVFEETPLKKVLEALQKTYGITIKAEKENLYNCQFTGDVSRQGLYAKLDIICQAVQASYEVRGTEIFIKGSGCN